MRRLILFTAMLTIAFCTSCDKNNKGNDDDNKSPVDNPTYVAKKYVVGNYYNKDGIKGIVYKLNAGDTSGMILSMDETTASWAKDIAIEKIQTDATNGEDGMENMKKIKTLDIDNYPAFKWCDNKNKDGITGWYLPATRELDEIYNAQNENVNSINDSIIAHGGVSLSSVEYWSSSEVGTVIPPVMNAYTLNFQNFVQGKIAKSTTTLYVRAVRAF
jgi:hypothetical protein